MGDTLGIDRAKSRLIKDSAAKKAAIQPASTRYCSRDDRAIEKPRNSGLGKSGCRANLAYQQGNYAVADTLEAAAYELGKPIE